MCNKNNPDCILIGWELVKWRISQPLMPIIHFPPLLVTKRDNFPSHTSTPTRFFLPPRLFSLWEQGERWCPADHCLIESCHIHWRKNSVPWPSYRQPTLGRKTHFACDLQWDGNCVFFPILMFFLVFLFSPFLFAVANKRFWIAGWNAGGHIFSL